jgi:hypothetical protein
MICSGIVSSQTTAQHDHTAHPLAQDLGYPHRLFATTTAAAISPPTALAFAHVEQLFRGVLASRGSELTIIGLAWADFSGAQHNTSTAKQAKENAPGRNA